MSYLLSIGKIPQNEMKLEQIKWMELHLWAQVSYSARIAQWKHKSAIKIMPKSSIQAHIYFFPRAKTAFLPKARPFLRLRGVDCRFSCKYSADSQHLRGISSNIRFIFRWCLINLKVVTIDQTFSIEYPERNIRAFSQTPNIERRERRWWPSLFRMK